MKSYKVIWKTLTSIAIVLLPVFAYPTNGWSSRGTGPSEEEIVVAIVTQGVEFEIFFWFLLWPIIGFCINRFRRSRVAGSQLPTPPREMGVWERALLMPGPCLAILIPVFGWMTGYRAFRGSSLEGVMLLLFPLSILFVIVRLALVLAYSRATWRSVALRTILSLVLLVGSWFTIPTFEPSFFLGRTRLESEVGLQRLASECVHLVKRYAKPGRSQLLVDLGVRETPSIRRLRPTYITVESDRLAIELHGGFDHYGYELFKDQKAGKWIFGWYNEGGVGNQKIMSWPIEADLPVAQ